jgi:hypothetical protein
VTALAPAVGDGCCEGETDGAEGDAAGSVGAMHAASISPVSNSQKIAHRPMCEARRACGTSVCLYEPREFSAIELVLQEIEHALLRAGVTDVELEQTERRRGKHVGTYSTNAQAAH